jgi:hypothetical protein
MGSTSSLYILGTMDAMVLARAASPGTMRNPAIVFREIVIEGDSMVVDYCGRNGAGSLFLVYLYSNRLVKSSYSLRVSQYFLVFLYYMLSINLDINL